ncbi:hypothetical protein A1O7_05368 [Cladophialophora yegresii CBS 114405]|uniref:Uncharacterized protein n=1 Tax=Cladophialophora yegresii CBS 114405 TaxID=1182544 RepID=W9VZ15_9EURO|nr:uncharacterized protein A1O7_05368 [Cladophialophora yegresii CBS 114405]EXJ57945.1 hypothetical protein A1O7_05368 [Cladophialophora yegresii CBS 114405]
MMKCGWLAPVGRQDMIPPVPELVEGTEIGQRGGGEEGEVASSLTGTREEEHAYHVPHAAATAHGKTTELKRYQLAKVSNESCNAQGMSCSCTHNECQMH